MKRIIILFFLCCTIPLIAQHTDPIQEAMANYDYETALSLIAQKKTTPPLLLQKGKALRGLDSPQRHLLPIKKLSVMILQILVLSLKRPNVAEH